ncbi:MAG: 30S ribosomal protein S2, partial [Ignavibacteriaceae bacterium]|nr:30S ribosomal protein S2 [Ignavibacteriaceae bacterium]
TNCDPDIVDYMIPANDDAVKTIEIIIKTLADAIIEGNLKAKELKAEDTAASERVKKEQEKDKEETTA